MSVFSISGFDYDVFLSFADHDSEFAQKILYNPLTKKGYKVFLHLTNFTAGMTIEDNIMRAVSISRVVLYICSKNFNQSSFCQKELKYGMESHYGRYRGRYRRVVPIVIGGDCPAELNTFKIRPIRTSGCVEDYTEGMTSDLLKMVNLGKCMKLFYIYIYAVLMLYIPHIGRQTTCTCKGKPRWS